MSDRSGNPPGRYKSEGSTRRWADPIVVSDRRLDALKTQMQETGRCSAHGVSVAEMVDIIDSLGLDPRKVGVYGGFGGSYLAIVRPPGERQET